MKASLNLWKLPGRKYNVRIKNISVDETFPSKDNSHSRYRILQYVWTEWNYLASIWRYEKPPRITNLKAKRKQKNLFFKVPWKSQAKKPEGMRRELDWTQENHGRKIKSFCEMNSKFQDA